MRREVDETSSRSYLVVGNDIANAEILGPAIIA